LSLAKQSAIQKLGYGNLNKIALEFTETFWDDAVDYFGCAADTSNRGRNFMYWNLAPVCGKPVLVALVAGEAAEKAETESDESLVKDAMSVLRRVASRNSQGLGAKWSSLVPDPTAYVCTRWGSDPHSRGSYSYVAVGASGDDYDELGRPEGRVLFAGEHTCREHPDTVGGAMLTGWRAARHAMHIMNGDHGTPFDEVFAMPTMDDLVFADGDDEDSESGDDDGDSGTYWDFPKSRTTACPYNTDTFLSQRRRRHGRRRNRRRLEP
jgi:monoamine oxidase